MSNIAAQAASLGLNASQVANSAVHSMGSGLIAGQTASQYANNLAQQQLASQNITPLGQAQSSIMSGINPSGGIAGIAAGINAGAGSGAAAAENNAMQAAQEANTGGAISNVAGLLAGGNPYADSEENAITAGMAVGNAPIATAGNFNPKVQFAAARMFGPQKYRKKPLITF